MTLRGVVFIAFRFYAVSLLISIIPVLPTMISFFGVANDDAKSIWIELSLPLAYALTAALLWLASGRLARGIARDFNPEIKFQVTLEEALAFSFVFLGVYFFVSSISSAAIQLYQLMSMTETEPQSSPVRARLETDFCRSGLTVATALACIFCSRIWARKLTRRG